MDVAFSRRACALGAALALLASATAGAATLPAGSFVFDGVVGAIARSGGDVLVGGEFTREQTPTGGGLVLSTAGTGEPDPSQFPRVVGTVLAVAPDGSGGWFIGGDFTRVAGQARHDLAHVLADGTLDASWDPSPDEPVRALALSGSALYVGGDFTTAGGQPRNHLAAVSRSTGDATAWDPDPDGATIGALALSGATVYAGGDFASIGGQPRRNLAALDAAGDATAWDPDPNSLVSTIAVEGSTIYAGGYFTTIGGQARGAVAALDATTGDATAWNPDATAGNTRFGAVSALAVSGSTVYLGGDFFSMGGQPRNGLAAVSATTGTPTSWDPNPSGAQLSDDGRVIGALVVVGSHVYTGGNFSTIGGQPRRNLAVLDATTGAATSWNPNPNRSVAALAVSGSSVYAGGSFSGAGAPLATIAGVAKVNAAGDLDTSWHPDLDGTVGLLAASSSTVYLSGDFTAIDGQPRGGLAAVDVATGAASAWNPGAPGGPDAYVNVLTASESAVYAAGNFDSLGGQPRDKIAALDPVTGAATAFNPASDGWISAIATSGPSVYLGGGFSTLAGQPSVGLAALNATTGAATGWNPNLVSDAEPDILALTLSGSTLYMRGQFTSVGGQPRYELAAVDAISGAATPWNPNLGRRVISEIAATESAVYTGEVTAAPGVPLRGVIGALDPATGAPTAWHPVANSPVIALAASGTTVYAGGFFSAIDGALTGPFAVLEADLTPAPDTVAPRITITSPLDGLHYRFGEPVSSAFACDDGGGGSGVQSCSGPATVSTDTPGTHEFTVTTSDHDGNSATATVHYVVWPPPLVGPPAPPPAVPPPPPVAPPPAPAPADKAAPKASLSGAATERLSKTVAVGVACSDEACTATTTASVTVPRVGRTKARTYKLKAVTTKIAKGKKATVRLALSTSTRSAIRRALVAHKRVTVKVTSTVRDAAGNRRKLSRNVKLRR